MRGQCFLTHYKRIAAIHNFSFKITRQAGQLVAKVLDKQQRHNLILYKVFSFLIIKSLLVFMYNPLKSFFVNHELLSLLPMDIIFTDQTNLLGFIIANLIMSVMGVYLVSVSLFISLHFFVAISNYLIQVELIKVDIEKLDAFCSDTSTSTLSQRHSFLRNICQKCQDKDE